MTSSLSGRCLPGFPVQTRNVLVYVDGDVIADLRPISDEFQLRPINYSKNKQNMQDKVCNENERFETG